MKATIDGVVRSPSLFSMTRGLPPSMMATHELVVPRSMPMILPMRVLRRILSDVRLGATCWVLRVVQVLSRPNALQGACDTITRAGRSSRPLSS